MNVDKYYLFLAFNFDHILLLYSCIIILFIHSFPFFFFLAQKWHNNYLFIITYLYSYMQKLQENVNINIL